SLYSLSFCYFLSFSSFLFFFHSLSSHLYLHSFLHDALPISQEELANRLNVVRQTISKWEKGLSVPDSSMLISLADELDTSESILDRKSTRLNSSHVSISYAVFCLKKKTSRESHFDMYLAAWE